jgi:hypothetical protein
MMETMGTRAKAQITLMLAEAYQLDRKIEEELAESGLADRRKLLQDQLAALEAEIADLTADYVIAQDGVLAGISKIAILYQMSVKCRYGEVAFRSGYPRVTYKAKALDALATRPDYEWLLGTDYRKEKQVKPLAKVTIFSELAS